MTYSRTNRQHLKDVSIGLAVVLPLITTAILLWQHTSESGNPVILGRWTSIYFLIALFPALITFPIFAYFFVRRSENLVNFAVVVLSVYAVLIPLEIATHTRVVNAFGPAFVDRIPSSCIQAGILSERGFTDEVRKVDYDGVPGFQMEPYLEYSAHSPPDKGEYQMYPRKLDHNGLNNNQSIADLPNIDILMVGDSFTDGALPRDENFVTVTSQLLDQPVLNLGIGGTAPQQQRWVVEEVGLDYSPKVVVWQLFENDIYGAVIMDEWLSDNRGLTFVEFNKQAYHTAITVSFSKEECRSIALRGPFLFLGLIQEIRTKRSEAPVTRYPLVTNQNSEDSPYFVFWTGEFNNDALCHYPLTRSEWLEKTRVGHHGTVIELESTLSDALQLIETEIERLARIGQQNGFEIVIMPVPTKELTYQDQILGHLQKTRGDLRCEDGRPPKVQQHDFYWLEWLQETSAKYPVEYLDLLAYFRHEIIDDNKEAFYYTTDSHLNTAGNAATGKLIAQLLKKKGF